MHPLEHFLYAHHSPHNTATPSHCLGGATSIRYYTCTLLPLVMTLHPAHFLFAKFHADVSPVAGHDGHDQPGGGSHFLYLHHAYFDCTAHTHSTACSRRKAPCALTHCSCCGMDTQATTGHPWCHLTSCSTRFASPSLENNEYMFQNLAQAKLLS